MKLTKQLAAISAAAIVAVLFSAGGAQAQGDGGLLSLLTNTPGLHVSHPMGQVRKGNSGGQGGSTTTTNNNNNNNNNAGGVNNNNNNNGGGVNNNNNNNNGSTAGTQGGGGLLSLLGLNSLFRFQVCYPLGQTGKGNTFSGNQNINCVQN
ncbi:hypothetical protein [Streptomyces broussonetiae]|uniref:hypothetical protein n=1 Tax=Streptomyces broussonetiae TaxID=2686304 RepID=UPI0035D5F2C6